MLLICSKTPRVQKKSWNTHVAFKTFRSVLYSWPSTLQTPLSDTVNTTEDNHPPSRLLTFHSSDHSRFSAQKSFLTLHSFQDQIYLSRSKPEHHFFLLSPTYSLLLLENLFFFTYKIWHLIYSNYIIYFDHYTECTIRAGSIFILYAVKC